MQTIALYGSHLSVSFERSECGWRFSFVDDRFGTDEFLDLCKLTHAEPQFDLNMGSGFWVRMTCPAHIVWRPAATRSQTLRLGSCLVHDHLLIEGDQQEFVGAQRQAADGVAVNRDSGIADR